MIRGRIPEVTIKFSEMPKLSLERKVTVEGASVSMQGGSKRVTLEVQGVNNVVVRAEVNRKTLKKQIAKMHEYEDWVAALSGKVAQIADDGVIELDGAGITVFEKKKKDLGPE